MSHSGLRILLKLYLFDQLKRLFFFTLECIAYRILKATFITKNINHPITYVGSAVLVLPSLTKKDIGTLCKIFYD